MREWLLWSVVEMEGDEPVVVALWLTYLIWSVPAHTAPAVAYMPDTVCGGSHDATRPLVLLGLLSQTIR